ncbi:MAG: hypothetical protein ACFCUE_11255 [Candidatus Bathyarchaeia archaeon]|jgi:hypothetical protein
MSDYKLQVCKPFENGDWKGIYRFMVINPNDHRGYPANYVCMLPRKIYDRGKPLSVFVRKFGHNVDFAVELLQEAILREKDATTKSALEKRLKNFITDPALGKTKKPVFVNTALVKTCSEEIQI